MVLALTYVLNTALANEVVPAGYIRPLAVATLLAGLLTLVAWTIFRNRWDGALFVSGVILLAVSPISLAWVWTSLRTVFGALLGTTLTALALVAALGAVGVRALQMRRQGQPLPRPAPEMLNVFSFALLAAVIGSNISSIALPASASVPPPLGWHADGPDQPDIVILLLDGYPRTDVLERRFGAHDTAFLEALRERGFEVATTNHSNYTLTELTFASMFQMRYIDQIPSLKPFIGTGRQENAALRDAAESGQAFSILRAAGYELSWFPGGWEHVALRRAADRFLDSGELSDLERSVMHRTWFLYLLDAVWPSIFTSSQRDRIVHGFDTVDRFATEEPDGQRFLFLHVPAPHLPPVVNADGTPTALRATRYEGISRQGYGMTDSQYRDAWQAELDYVADRVLHGIDLLLDSERGREAVIIVLSDHGYGFELQQGDTQARLGNLFAARTPGAPALFEDPPTPVNLFGILFNSYLGTQIPLLPDRYFLQGNRQLDLTEIRDPDQVPK
jgi:Sulfatase